MGASRWNRRQRSWAHPLSHQEGSAMGTPSLRCTELPPTHQPPSWTPLYSIPTYPSSYLTPHAHPSTGANKGFSWEREGTRPPLQLTAAPDVTLVPRTSCLSLS